MSLEDMPVVELLGLVISDILFVEEVMCSSVRGVNFCHSDHTYHFVVTPKEIALQPTKKDHEGPRR